MCDKLILLGLRSFNYRLSYILSHYHLGQFQISQNLYICMTVDETPLLFNTAILHGFVKVLFKAPFSNTRFYFCTNFLLSLYATYNSFAYFKVIFIKFFFVSKIVANTKCSPKFFGISRWSSRKKSYNLYKHAFIIHAHSFLSNFNFYGHQQALISLNSLLKTFKTMH